MPRTYRERSLLRRAEALWARAAACLDRAGAGRLNPLYHLGALSLFFLLVLGITGIALVIFYRPGMERSYASLSGLSAHPLGHLLRSVHRYAGDALMVTALLHALRLLLMDRFWGARWLAWVSGWAMVVLVGLIGLLGFWLVWDTRAQWLTEAAFRLLGPATALTFLGPEAEGRSFALFVILLFLHIFLGILLLLGLLIHTARLTRPRLWPPRPLAALALLALVGVGLAFPTPLLEEVDFSRRVSRVPLDLLLLGPPALAQRLGAWVWPLLGGGLALLAALPWLARGRHLGPARVEGSACTGCSLCLQECPYGAIDRVEGPSRRGKVAEVRPERCTGCGVCVGTCFQAGMELEGLPRRVLLDRVRETLARSGGRGFRPAVIYACERHLALGGLPTPEPLRRPTPAPVGSLSVPVGNPERREAVVCALPCAGMVNPAWFLAHLREGASGGAVLACPPDDCLYREGSLRIARRLARWQGVLKGRVHPVVAPPADRRAVLEGLERALAGTAPGLPAPPPGLRRVPAYALALGALLLFPLAGALLERPVSLGPPGLGEVRILVSRPGRLQRADRPPPELAGTLPPGVNPAQVLGGARHPIRVRLEVNGRPLLQETFRPSGVRREGRIYGLARLTLRPGHHRMRLWVMEDGRTWSLAYRGTLYVAEDRVSTFLLDEEGLRVLGPPAP